MVRADQLANGDTVWLVARTLTAPFICWSNPRGTVLGIERAYQVRVELDTGETITVHIDNVQKSQPKPREHRRGHRRPPATPEGVEQPGLFGGDR